MIRSMLIILVLAAGTLVGGARAHAATPGTSFTYQGVLTEGGTPVTTPVDVRFTLYSDAGGTSQVGPPVTVSNITPDEGVFSASIDFGAAAFGANQALWLRVEVSPAGLGTFDDLGLEALEAAPFALNTRGIQVSDDERVGIGFGSFPNGAPFTLTVTGDDAAAFIQSPPGSDASLHLMSDSSFLSTLYAPTGTNDLRVSHEGTGDVMTITQGGDVGIGIDTPQARLDVRSTEPDATGIRVDQTGTGTTVGMEATVTDGYGVRGVSTATSGSHYGVYGQSSSANGWGVYANGRLGASGTKSFMIDHPLDPAGAYLLHYSSESPEPQNRYNGNVVLDGNGVGVVRLPDYFQSINADFRYQLTAIGAPAPNLYVAQKIENNRFVIAGGQPGQEISWEVVARRNDAFVAQRGAPIEVQKIGPERGRFLMPELYGQPREMGVNFAGRDETEAR